MTNADRIRSMTDEELADIISGDWCELLNCKSPCDGHCDLRLLEWLRMSAQSDKPEPQTDIVQITGEYNVYHGELDVQNGTLKVYGSSFADRCVCCGAIVPEGRMVCPTCERRANE